MGIDEAGRGSVLGPLVVAGVALSESDLAELVRMGLDDSKKLTPRTREILAGEIRSRTSAIEVRLLLPAAIDGCRGEGGLDVLEADAMAAIARELAIRRVLVDAPGPGGRLFRERLSQRLGTNYSLTAENKADERYPVVSAASVLAKTVRDAEIRDLSRVHGPIGSGYPSDPTTLAFLESRARAGQGPPDFARRSWATVQRIFGSRQVGIFGG